MSATTKLSWRKGLEAGVLGFALMGLAGCGASGNKPNVELIQDMMESPALKAQDFHSWDREKSSQLEPAPGTVSREHTPYPYANDPIEAEAKLKNPLAEKMTAEVIKTGQQKYDIYCAVCHGETGYGDGTVAPKMALKPPSLMTEKIRNYKDGRIYHIITAGQGVMGAYAPQIYDENDRWAIVNYIRSLQKKQPVDKSAAGQAGSGG